MRIRNRHPITRAIRIGASVVFALSMMVLAGGLIAVTPASAAGVYHTYLVITNDSENQVSMTEGSDPSCVNNQGSVAGLNTPYGAFSNETIEVEFTDNGSCSTQSYRFPFTLDVNGTSLNYNEQWYSANPASSCNADAGGSNSDAGLGGMECDSTSSPCCQWSGGTSLVYYAPSFQLLFSSATYDGDNSVDIAINNNNAGTTAYEVPAAGQDRASLVDSSSANSPNVPPRQDVFASIPQSQQITESMKSGKLTIKQSMRLGSEAKALLSRVGNNKVVNSVSLMASASAGGETFNSSMSHVLPKGSLASKVRSRSESVTLSKNATQRLCSALASGKTSSVDLNTRQTIGEPARNYQMGFTTRLSLSKCPTG